MFYRNTVFKLSDTQYDRLNEWYERIINTKRSGDKYFGAIGGEISITFSPTSIGDFITAKCCGEEIDLSEV